MSIVSTEPARDPQANLAEIRSRIEAAAARAGRSPDDISLIAVSKRQPLSRVEAVLAAGHRVFGENRVQDAEARWPGLMRTHGDIELHMVGPLQTNKARDALSLFHAIHSLDRLKLARAVAKAALDLGRVPALFVQVNTGEEPQKSGVLPGETDDFIRQCRDDLGLAIDGLMCLPPAHEEPSLHFALLARIANRNGLEKLSMGMSHDFEVAIEFGATHVRVGTALFGARED